LRDAVSTDWYRITADEALTQAGIPFRDGLSPKEAARRLAEHGPNELAEADVKNPWRILVEPFTSLLIVAAMASAFLGDYEDAIAIFAIIVLNAVLGFRQEYRAEKTDDKEAILAAVKTTKLETIGGPIDFTEPVVGATPPFKVGPCHIVENVYKTPLVGGKWRKGTTWPYELTICSNAAGPSLSGSEVVLGVFLDLGPRSMTSCQHVRQSLLRSDRRSV